MTQITVTYGSGCFVEGDIISAASTRKDWFDGNFEVVRIEDDYTITTRPAWQRWQLMIMGGCSYLFLSLMIYLGVS